MEIIWEYRKTLTVPANTTSLGFRIEAPPRGRVGRLVVRQVGTSNLTGFTVDLFSLPVVSLTPGGQPPVSIHQDNARILPSITAAAGGTAAFFGADKGYPYANNYGGKYTEPDRAVYLLLTLTNAQTVATNWLVTIVIVQES